MAINEGRLGGQVPCITFDTGRYHKSEKLDAINAFSGNLYRYTPLNPADAEDRKVHTPELKLNAWSLGSIAAAAFEHSPLIADSSKTTDADFRGTVIVRIVRRGQVRIRCGDAETRMVPGQVYLFRAQNTLYPGEPGSSIALRIPGEMLGYDPSRHDSILCFEAQKSAGRVVSAALKTLFEALPAMTTAEAQQVTPMICNLLGGLIGSAEPTDKDRQIWHSARANAMRSYVLDNLTSADIGTNRLQAEFHVSRATVYRAFELDGGVLNFVREERLKAVERALRHATPQYGRVRQIAEAHGFRDQSAFTKSFKRYYGVRPSEMIGTGLTIQKRIASLSTLASGAVELPSLAQFWSGIAGTASH